MTGRDLEFDVVTVEPRQCGKTTLARQFVDEHSANYFDLEAPLSLRGFDLQELGPEALQQHWLRGSLFLGDPSGSRNRFINARQWAEGR